jgi:ketosteroid isomerase-like protein
MKIQKLVLMVLVVSLAGVPGVAAGADEKTVAEIRDMLDRHDKALNEQDISGLMATFAEGDKTTLMGTGPGELWVGKKEIQDAYAHFFEDFDKGTLAVDCGWKMGDAQGNMGWLMAICKVTDSLKDKKREYGLNISAVLEKAEGQWCFRTMHFSNLTGGE